MYATNGTDAHLASIGMVPPVPGRPERHLSNGCVAGAASVRRWTGW